MDRQDKKVVPSSGFSSCPAQTLPDTVADVEKANFSAVWQKNQQLRGSCSKVPPACSDIPWVEEMLSQVRKLWGWEVPIIPCSKEEATSGTIREEEDLQEMPTVVPLLAVLVDQHHLVFLGQQPPPSIAQLFTFSPAAIQGRQTKVHFLMFQLLQIFQRIENLHIYLYAQFFARESWICDPFPLGIQWLPIFQAQILRVRNMYVKKNQRVSSLIVLGFEILKTKLMIVSSQIFPCLVTCNLNAYLIWLI